MDKKDFPVYSLGNEVLGQSYMYTHNMLLRMPLQTALEESILRYTTLIDGLSLRSLHRERHSDYDIGSAFVI